MIVTINLLHPNSLTKFKVESFTTHNAIIQSQIELAQANTALNETQKTEAILNLKNQMVFYVDWFVPFMEKIKTFAKNSFDTKAGARFIARLCFFSLLQVEKFTNEKVNEINILVDYNCLSSGELKPVLRDAVNYLLNPAEIILAQQNDPIKQVKICNQIPWLNSTNINSVNDEKEIEIALPVNLTSNFKVLRQDEVTPANFHSVRATFWTKGAICFPGFNAKINTTKENVQNNLVPSTHLDLAKKIVAEFDDFIAQPSQTEPNVFVDNFLKYFKHLNGVANTPKSSRQNSQSSNINENIVNKDLSESKLSDDSNLLNSQNSDLSASPEYPLFNSTELATLSLKNSENAGLVGSASTSSFLKQLNASSKDNVFKPRRSLTAVASNSLTNAKNIEMSPDSVNSDISITSIPTTQPLTISLTTLAEELAEEDLLRLRQAEAAVFKANIDYQRITKEMKNKYRTMHVNPSNKPAHVSSRGRSTSETGGAPFFRSMSTSKIETVRHTSLGLKPKKSFE